MTPDKEVYNITHAGDLYRVILTADAITIRVFERGLSRAYELDLDEVPSEVRRIIEEEIL